MQQGNVKHSAKKQSFAAPFSPLVSFLSCCKPFKKPLVSIQLKTDNLLFYMWPCKDEKCNLEKREWVCKTSKWDTNSNKSQRPKLDDTTVFPERRFTSDGIPLN